jgi:diguanylate cyclase (GGDEF)-like protein
MHLVALRLTHQLRESSERDALTQLLNRRAMAERVRAAWRSQRRRGTPLAFVMLDIDHFKRVNDEQGHAAGDAVLQRLAQLLREQLRGEDLVARMGGEEFLLVLPDTDAEAATRLAERLREATQAARLGVTLSLGLTLADAEDRDEEAALRRADAALYRAKALGRDRLEVASLSPVPDR